MSAGRSFIIVLSFRLSVSKKRSLRKAFNSLEVVFNWSRGHK